MSSFNEATVLFRRLGGEKMFYFNGEWFSRVERNRRRWRTAGSSWRGVGSGVPSVQVKSAGSVGVACRAGWASTLRGGGGEELADAVTELVFRELRTQTGVLENEGTSSASVAKLQIPVVTWEHRS